MRIVKKSKLVYAYLIFMMLVGGAGMVITLLITQSSDGLFLNATSGHVLLFIASIFIFNKGYEGYNEYTAKKQEKDDES